MREQEIIERIQTLCAARSWTVYRLAKESGITYSTLCTMLHKCNAPSIATLIKICNGFGITLSQFFDTENARLLLSPTQQEHLHQWDHLSSENQAAVSKYMQYLLNEQTT